MFLRTGVTHASFLCLLLVCAMMTGQNAAAQQTPGITRFDPADATLLASPGSIRQVQGKYPPSVPLILWLKGCTPGKIDDPVKTLATDSTYVITIAGAGLSASGKQTAGDCKITTTLSIDPAAASAGYFIVNVVETTAKNTTQDRGYALLSLLDAAAAPIPANQQVDVIWGVLSQHICRDNFGRHLADDVYCIEVKIGNNTGHEVQLAGVGFRPSGSLTIGGVKFPAQTSPNVSYQSVRGAAQAFQFLTSRNLLVNGAGGLGILMASFNPFFHASFNVARWAAGTAVVGTALPSAVNAIMPDPTLKQLNNLDDEAFRDGKLIPNNTQVRTMVFVERRLLEGIGHTPYQHWCDAIYTKDTDAAKKCGKTKDDPFAVKLALGNIVIVGDEIDFIQRVVVDPNVTSQEVNPTVTDVEATTTQVTASLGGGAASNMTAEILTSSDGSITTPLSLTLASQQPDPSKLIFNVPQSLKPSTFYSIQFNIPGIPAITKSVQVPLAQNPSSPPPTASATTTKILVTFQGTAPTISSAAITTATIENDPNQSSPVDAAFKNPVKLTIDPTQPGASQILFDVSPNLTSGKQYILSMPGGTPASLSVTVQ
jgi:hypothetical protein